LSARLVFNHDNEIANWTWQAFNMPPAPVNLAIGIIDETGTVVGSAIWQDFNGSNVEFSYYGKGTLKRGVVRAIASITLNRFNANRMTVRTMKKRKALLRSLPKIGFRFEGVMKQYYGPTEGETAVRFVLFKPDLERLAGIKS
jgi:RimJ/RimL family protein N-acetyltransferase